MKISRTTFCALLLAQSLVTTRAVGQELSSRTDRADFETVIHFAAGTAVLDGSYMDNGSMLLGLDTFMVDKSAADIARVAIEAHTSPEGNGAVNEQLAVNRAECVKRYIVDRYPQVDRATVSTSAKAGLWIDLLPLIENDPNVPYRSEVIDIAGSNAAQTDISNKLVAIHGGVAYGYIAANILPHMRNATTLVVTVTTADQRTAVVNAPIADEQFELWFRHSGSMLDSGCRNNTQVLRAFNQLIDRNGDNLESITIKTFKASDEEVDQNLANARARSLRSYLKWKHPEIENQQIRTTIERGQTNPAYYVVSYRNDNTNAELVAARQTAEQAAAQAAEQAAAEQIAEQQPITIEAAQIAEPVESQQPADRLSVENRQSVSQFDNPFKSRYAEGRYGYGEGRKPLWAVKTNLLYDIALTPNIEWEIPWGNRFSINLEWQYGWWLRRDNTFCWELESGGIEPRIWFGNRATHRRLTGWFAGVFAQGGLYDFQLEEAAGYQGEFYVFAGLTGGYSVAVAKHLNMEFSLGVGYLITDYRHYHVEDNELIKQGYSMRFSSLLPAKAKVSLVWMWNGKDKKGGAK